MIIIIIIIIMRPLRVWLFNGLHFLVLLLFLLLLLFFFPLSVMVVVQLVMIGSRCEVKKVLAHVLS